MAEPNTLSTGDSAARSTAGQQTSGQSSGIVNRVKETATAQLSSQKDRGVDAIDSVAGAVRSSTQRLRDEQHDTLAGYVEKAADHIEGWSRRLREKDIDELLTDVQQFARRQPAVFIGSAFAAGIVAARFLKSSPRTNTRASGEWRRQQFGAGTAYSAASDRATPAGSTGDVGIGTTAVTNSDVQAPGSEFSTGGGAASRGTRTRPSPPRTERP
jgi:hypothetical protein